MSKPTLAAAERLDKHLYSRAGNRLLYTEALSDLASLVALIEEAEAALTHIHLNALDRNIARRADEAIARITAARSR